MQNNHVIAVQTFVKVDTFQYLLDALNSCIGIEKYTVILNIDSCSDMWYQNRLSWIENNKIIKKIAKSFQNNNFCKSVHIIENEHNLGAYTTCKNSIDNAMNFSDYVIFLEDDIILSKDALLFHENTWEIYKNDPNLFAICCGSIDMEHIDTDINNLYQLYSLSWIGSAEFGISKNIWEKYGHIRGQVNGDIDFGMICKNSNMYTICPKIKRCCRMGIDHPDSYSAYHHPKETYIEDRCKPYSDNFNINISSYGPFIY